MDTKTKLSDRKAFNSTLSPGKGFKPRKAKVKPTLAELKAKGIVKKASSLGKKESPRTIAVKYADSNFSRWTRLKAANGDGYLKCFICEAPLHWTEAVLMHCEARGAWSVRFSEVNGRPGCVACNDKPLGDRKNFRLRIAERFGQAALDDNIRMAGTMVQYTLSDLNFVGDTYAERIEWIRKHEPSKFDH